MVKRTRHPTRARAPWLLALWALLLALLVPASASAVPKAHLLRVDPRASQDEGTPILTTVVEIVQSERLSLLTGPCSATSGDPYYDCVADRLEKKQALYSPFDFPKDQAIFSVRIDGQDTPASFVSQDRWGSSKGDDGVGTAWLIVIDAGHSMRGSLGDAKAVAKAFVNSMRENDIVDIMYINDKAVFSDSKWTDDKKEALRAIDSVGGAFARTGRTRGLFTTIKNAATDGFGGLGNVGSKVDVPLHQAMVVLSSGSAGADPLTTGAGASTLAKYMSNGRFPEDNTALPKAPVPVISIWFPVNDYDEYENSQREFMENAANVELGGFYSIVRSGQGERRAKKIVDAVRQRFDKMHIIKWKVSCVAPKLTQSFTLAFRGTDPTIAPDDTFKDVPVGIDPSAWPLDIDVEATEKEAKDNPLYPGGTMKVFGNFCWGGDKERAELYLLPKGQSPPKTLDGATLEEAQDAKKTLIKEGLKGTVLAADADSVEFQLPDNDKFLIGSEEKLKARVIIYDNVAQRTSAVTADKILELKAQEAPRTMFYVIVGGGVFGGVVLILLLVAAFRSGGSKRRSTATPPPKPVVAGAPVKAGGPAPMAAPMPMGGPPGGMPMGGPPPGQPASQATLTGAAGIFTVLPGMEMRAGRDGANCQILLSEPRVSGVHATVKLEGPQLLVRDENSNNGTSINGQRIAAGMWTPVPPGAQLRFGPVEFAVRIE